MSGWRRVAAVAATLVAGPGALILSPGGVVAAAAAPTRPTAVTVSVLSVNPSTPAITSTARPLTITVSLVNTSSVTLTGVTVAAERGDAITTQAVLDASLKSTAARTDGKAITPTAAPRLTLAPGATVRTAFRTTTSNQDDNYVCLCAKAGVYPIDITAQTTVDGVPTVLGGTRTYLPAFDADPVHKIGITWIWPLIDPPHRSVDGNVFTDDDLATSVASGRLDRALQVVEDVEKVADVPMTLMIDPDLLDELYVMSLGPYTVTTPEGVVTAGTGQQAAADWLSRLQSVLAAHPDLDVELTPLADPDVTGLSEHGQVWSTGLSSTVTADVTRALGGGRLPTNAIAWPPTGSATVDTLDRLVKGGAGTVVLDGSRVRPSTRSGTPVSSAVLRTSTGTVDALLTAPALQRYAQTVLAGSVAALPELMSELAVRVGQHPNAVQTAVLTAPRYVDPTSPDVAAHAILDTSRSLFSRPVSAAGVVGALPAATSPSTVRAPVATSAGLSRQQLDHISTIVDYVQPVDSLIGGIRGSAAGQTIVATLPSAVQRSESAAWSRAGSSAAVGGGPAAGALRARALTTQLTGYLNSVSILKPSSGSYTLASSDSPLPISVRNGLAVSVQVRVSVGTVGGLPGLPATKIGVVQVPANSKATFKIPTHVQRSGRIPVQAQLYTADDYPLGDPVTVIVHSTVLGAIGVVITVTAGVVLVLALLVRYVRRVLRIRTKRAQVRTP